MYVHVHVHNIHVDVMYIHDKSSVQCQRKEGANPGQLFQAFGPHQQGAEPQSLPDTAGLTYMYMYMYMYSISLSMVVLCI